MSLAASQIARISAEQWGAAAEVEVAVRVHGVFPLPIGMEREEICEEAGLETWKGSMSP